MRIVDLTTLRAMPQGTLFQKYAPCHFDDMAIFDHALGERDFVVCEFGSGPIETHSSEDFTDKCDDMAERGASYPVGFDSYGRDGCFEDGQLFAIWEPDDVRALIAKLEAGLAQGMSAGTAETQSGSGRKPASPVVVDDAPDPSIASQGKDRNGGEG